VLDLHANPYTIFSSQIDASGGLSEVYNAQRLCADGADRVGLHLVICSHHGLPVQLPHEPGVSHSPAGDYPDEYG
jgi:hypothetical protein